MRDPQDLCTPSAGEPLTAADDLTGGRPTNRIITYADPPERLPAEEFPAAEEK